MAALTWIFAGGGAPCQICFIMFESANLKHEVAKAAYRREQARLRAALLEAQYDLKVRCSFPCLILIAGVEGAGKAETVNLLNEWMDPRHIQTTAFGPPSDEEIQRPAHWRFWRALPPKGQIGIFFGAWHTLPIVQRVMGDIGDGEFSSADRRNPAPRKDVVRRGRTAVEVLVPPLQGPTKQAAQVTREGPEHALACDRNRMGVFQAVRPIRRGLRAVPPPDVYCAGALDRGAGGRTRISGCSLSAGTCWRRCAIGSKRSRSRSNLT